ncbi:MAG: hypothetical protein PVI35_04385 [Acidimicrobiia bacterium]|jgi:hypothetical protein
MIRRLYRMLPGPTPLRILLSIVIIAGVLVGLHFFYDWLGAIVFDTGGTVG